MGCCICATAIQVAYLNPPSIEQILLAYLVDACCITGTGKLGRGSYPVFGSWRRRVGLLLQASGPVCLALGISTGNRRCYLCCGTGWGRRMGRYDFR